MNKYKLEMLEYAKEFCRRLNEMYKEQLSYVYKITIIQDVEKNLFTVNLGIDIKNDFITSKNKIRFFTNNQFEKFSEEKQKEYFGDFYNASIMGKHKDEFKIEDVERDFLEICSFNYVKDNANVKNEDEIVVLIYKNEVRWEGRRKELEEEDNENTLPVYLDECEVFTKDEWEKNIYNKKNTVRNNEEDELE